MLTLIIHIIAIHIEFSFKLNFVSTTNFFEYVIIVSISQRYRQKGEYDIFNDITANITLVQLMDSLGNVNHAISVVGSWIFDSNY